MAIVATLTATLRGIDELRQIETMRILNAQIVIPFAGKLLTSLP
jgi:hypothetical protein